MDFIMILISFVIMATFVTIATDVFVKILQTLVNAICMFLTFVLKRQHTPLQPIKLQQFKLIVAFIMTMLIILAYNRGILTTLEIPIAESKEWFPVVDIWATIIFLTGGARSVHKLQEKLGKESERE